MCKTSLAAVLCRMLYLPFVACPKLHYTRSTLAKVFESYNVLSWHQATFPYCQVTDAIILCSIGPVALRNFDRTWTEKASLTCRNCNLISRPISAVLPISPTPSQTGMQSVWQRWVWVQGRLPQSVAERTAIIAPKNWMQPESWILHVIYEQIWSNCWPLISFYKCDFNALSKVSVYNWLWWTLYIHICIH